MEEIRQLVLKTLNKSTKEMHRQDLYNSINCDKNLKKKYFDDVIYKLEIEGKIYKNTNSLYSVAPPNYHVVELLPTSGNSKKFYIDNKKYLINANHLNGALDFDLVGVKVYTDNSVKLIRNLKRNTGHIVCEMIAGKNGELIAKKIDGNLPIKIISKERKDLVEGDLVLLTIKEEKTNDYFEAEIENILGHKDDPNVEIRAICASKDIRMDFSNEYLKELENIPTSLRDEDYEGRIDLRDENIFTIDCDTTKDMDDAVGIKILENGNFLLTVSIADVSHYIKPNSILFDEASKRTTSYYLNNCVIPMFHHKISSGICSLNPNVDRLATTISMEIDKNGDVIDYRIFKSVINSRKKMKYSEVNKIIEEDNLVEGYKPYLKDLLLMQELSKIIENTKLDNGYLNFTSNEIYINYDEDNTPLEFNKRISRSAEKMIENFMIIANTTYAAHCYYMDIPCVYRNHGEPDEEKLMETIDYLCELGYSHLLNGNFRGTKRELQILLNKINKLEEKDILSNLVLRSMKRARYSSENKGHYALSLNIYGQFTSPIRRLGDYLNHTFLDQYYFFKNVNNIEKVEENLDEYIENTNHCEVIAEAAENMALELEMSKYMKEHLNKEFIARIISIDYKGIKIITNNNIIGYIDLNDLSNNYKFDSKHFGRVGDKVLVTSYWIDKFNNKIYFTLDKNLSLENSKNNYKKKIRNRK